VRRRSLLAGFFPASLSCLVHRFTLFLKCKSVRLVCESQVLAFFLLCRLRADLVFGVPKNDTCLFSPLGAVTRHDFARLFFCEASFSEPFDVHASSRSPQCLELFGPPVCPHLLLSFTQPKPPPMVGVPKQLTLPV